jgi:hypothetical protein
MSNRRNSWSGTIPANRLIGPGEETPTLASYEVENQDIAFTPHTNTHNPFVPSGFTPYLGPGFVSWIHSKECPGCHDFLGHIAEHLDTTLSPDHSDPLTTFPNFIAAVKRHMPVLYDRFSLYVASELASASIPERNPRSLQERIDLPSRERSSSPQHSHSRYATAPPRPVTTSS